MFMSILLRDTWPTFAEKKDGTRGRLRHFMPLQLAPPEKNHVVSRHDGGDRLDFCSYRTDIYPAAFLGFLWSLNLGFWCGIVWLYLPIFWWNFIRYIYRSSHEVWDSIYSLHFWFFGLVIWHLPWGLSRVFMSRKTLDFFVKERPRKSMISAWILVCIIFIYTYLIYILSCTKRFHLKKKKKHKHTSPVSHI